MQQNKDCCKNSEAKRCEAPQHDEEDRYTNTDSTMLSSSFQNLINDHFKRNLSQKRKEQ